MKMLRAFTCFLIFIAISFSLESQEKSLDSIWHLSFGASIEEVTAQLKKSDIQIIHQNQNLENSETILNVEWKPIFGRTAQVIQIIFQGGRFVKLRVLYPSSGSDPTTGDLNYFDIRGSIEQQFFKGKPLTHLRNGSIWSFPGGGKIYLGQIIPSIIVAIAER